MVRRTIGESFGCLLLLLIVSHMLLQQQFRVASSPRNSLLAGSAAGFAGGLCGMLGPPAVAYLLGRHNGADKTRSDIIVFVTGASLMLGVTYLIYGMYSASHLKLSALLMPIGILLVWQPPIPLTLLLISLSLFAHNAWKTNLVTLTVDIFPRRVIGTIHGIVATGGGIGGMIITPLAGYVITLYSYTPLLIVMGLLHPLAYLCLHPLIKEGASPTQQWQEQAL